MESPPAVILGLITTYKRLTNDGNKSKSCVWLQMKKLQDQDVRDCIGHPISNLDAPIPSRKEIDWNAVHPKIAHQSPSGLTFDHSGSWFSCFLHSIYSAIILAPLHGWSLVVGLTSASASSWLSFPFSFQHSCVVWDPVVFGKREGGKFCFPDALMPVLNEFGTEV